MTLIERWRFISAEPRRWVAAIAVALVLFQLALRGWVGYRGYFYLDDFAFVGRSAQYGLSPGKLLFRSYNNHLMPAAFFEVWTLTKLWPLNFVPVVTLALALQLGLEVLFYKLLRELFGARAAILVPFTIFTMSPITLPAFLWWAASLNQLPQQMAMVAALLCHVRYLRTGRVWRGVLGVVAIAAGLLFSEKTLLAVPLVVAFTYAFATGGPAWPRLRRAWSDHRAVWLTYLVLVVPYVIYYLAAVPSPGRTGAQGGALVSLAATALRDGLLPGALGGPWSWTPLGYAGALASPGPLAAFLASAVAVIGIVITIVCNRRAVFAWIIAAGFVAVDILLLGLTRASAFGAVLGSEYRYFADCALVIALAIGLSVLPIGGSFSRGFVQRLDGREWALQARRSGRVSDVRTAIWLPGRLTTALTVVLAVVISATVSTVRYDRYWHPNPARPFVTTLHDELLHADRNVVLYDQSVPAPVILGLLNPYQFLSRLTAVWPHLARFLSAGHPTPALTVVDDTGHLRRAGMHGVKSIAGPKKSCGYFVHTSSVTIELADTSIDRQAVLRMGYLANADGAVRITTGSTSQIVPVTKGLSSSYLVVPRHLGKLQVSATQPGLSVCTDDITVGLPYALPGTSVR